MSGVAVLAAPGERERIAGYDPVVIKMPILRQETKETARSVADKAQKKALLPVSHPASEVTSAAESKAGG